MFTVTYVRRITHNLSYVGIWIVIAYAICVREPEQ